MASSPKQPSSSPKWIRPIEVLSLRRKTKRSSTVLQPLDTNVLTSRFSLPSSSQHHSSSFNPFRKFPQKRKLEDALQENTESLDRVLGFGKSCDSESSLNCNNFKRWTPALFDETANSATLDDENIPKPAAPERFSHLPLDWSIKTRVRFMSTKPFPFHGTLKTSEEASGTTAFTRCIHSSKVQECSVDTSANAKFHQQCLVWQHPSLPWLKLFPRSQDSKGGQTSILGNNLSLQESLFDDWCDSLRSLYQLVRARQCPFFYLCGNSFTILFRASGVNGLSDTHAYLTPTTSGIRKVLRSQGVEFSMPLCPKTDSQDPDASVDATLDPLAAQDGDCSPGKDEEKEEEPAEFLESLGLSQQDFPSINPKRRKTEQDCKDGNMDTRKQSLICIEGRDCHVLMDFLLSSRSTSMNVATTGPLAGVPPTLLAPCAFQGATLRSIKARQGWIKQGDKTKHCVDLSGPILPNMVHGLVSLSSGTQKGNFSAVLASDPVTTCFTAVSPDKDACMPSAFATENLKDCGLSAEFLLRICSASERVVLHELDAEEKLFTWR